MCSCSPTPGMTPGVGAIPTPAPVSDTRAQKQPTEACTVHTSPRTAFALQAHLTRLGHLQPCPPRCGSCRRKSYTVCTPTIVRIDDDHRPCKSASPCGPPMQNFANPSFTADLAMCLQKQTVDLSTLARSFAGECSTPCAHQQPYVSRMIFRPVSLQFPVDRQC